MAPDRGRHGFLAIKNPVEMRDRLKQWRGLVYDHGDDADLAFSRQNVSSTTGAIETPDVEGRPVADIGAAVSAEQPQQASSGLTVINRAHRFALTLPKHWTGRLATRETRRPKVLGIQLPFPILVFSNEAHLPATTEDWNYLELSGLGGATFELELLEGPVPTTYAAEMQVLQEKGHSDGVIQSFPDINQASMSGFSIIFDLKTGAVSLDTGVVRRVWLGNEKFHLSIYAKVTASDSGAQSEAMDAMVASIRAI